jgi:topoisomerase IA-like protein
LASPNPANVYFNAGEKEVPMPKGTNMKSFTDNNVKSFISSQEQAYARSLYLKK